MQALKTAVEISKAIFFLQTQNGHGNFQGHFFSSKHKTAKEISKAIFFLTNSVCDKMKIDLQPLCGKFALILKGI